jgi:hypothetical protein
MNAEWRSSVALETAVIERTTVLVCRRATGRRRFNFGQ